jgi:aspartate/tyrosine/aromatic aminotransferase
MSADDWSATVDVLARRAEAGTVTVLLDAAYSAYGTAGNLDLPLSALAPACDRLRVLVAWSASKTFTHYGLRVGALAAVVPDAKERADTAAALTHACRGTWSNCNRGGMLAVTRLLVDPALRAAVDQERAGFVRLLSERVATFNDAARKARLPHPRYDGGFFTTVFTADAPAAAKRMRAEGVYAVPIEGALRLGLCSVPRSDVPRLVDATARAVR